MLWVGERTRQLDHAHVHFCSGCNPTHSLSFAHCIVAHSLMALDMAHANALLIQQPPILTFSHMNILSHYYALTLTRSISQYRN